MTHKIFIFLTATSFMLAPLAEVEKMTFIGNCNTEEVEEWDETSQHEACEGYFSMEEARENSEGMNEECGLDKNKAQVAACAKQIYHSMDRFLKAKPDLLGPVSFSHADYSSNFYQHRQMVVAQIDNAMANGQIMDPFHQGMLQEANQVLRELPYAPDVDNNPQIPAEYATQLANNLQGIITQDPQLNLAIKGAALEFSSYAALLNLGDNPPQAFAKALIPHITDLESGFQTDLILTNHGSAQREFEFHAYADNGDFLQHVEGTIQSYETVRLDPVELFKLENVSHVVVDQAEGIDIAVSYQAGANGCPLYLKTTETFENTYRLFAGDWDQVWDGVALVNVGQEPAKIQIRQINSKGVVIKTMEIESIQDLPPMAKSLLIFNDLGFVPDPGSQFQISADQNLSVLSLRGPLNGDAQFMWENHVIAD